MARNLSEACYFDFLKPAAEVISGNPYAYGHYALALSRWTFSREPERIPCFRQASENYIQVDGGTAATYPGSIQPCRGDFYGIFSNPATGDRLIWHDNPLGVRYTFTAKQGCGTTCHAISRMFCIAYSVKLRDFQSLEKSMRENLRKLWITRIFRFEQSENFWQSINTINFSLCSK